MSATSSEAAKLRAAGVTVFSIGVGSGAKMSELNAMATNPDSSHVFTVTNFNSLSTIKGTLAQKTCEGESCFQWVYCIIILATIYTVNEGSDQAVHSFRFTSFQLRQNKTVCVLEYPYPTLCT